MQWIGRDTMTCFRRLSNYALRGARKTGSNYISHGRLIEMAPVPPFQLGFSCVTLAFAVQLCSTAFAYLASKSSFGIKLSLKVEEHNLKLERDWARSSYKKNGAFRAESDGVRKANDV